MAMRPVLCLSTTKPASAVNSGSGGGSLTMLCPYTGSITSSLRISGDLSHLTVGIQNLSLFPPGCGSSSNGIMAVACGSSTNKQEDSYGMLLTIKSAQAPILHWKCRLPEPLMSAGLLVSACGNYIMGGGNSGNVYVWKAVGGILLNTVKAHYRSVTALVLSDCGRLLVTGGADGLVHAFWLRDLVETPPTHPQAFKTSSQHTLPVTALVALPSGRIASSSHDGQVLLWELSSQAVLAKLQVPVVARCMAVDFNRLYVGCDDGEIYIFDLDAYSIHQTRMQGVVIPQRQEPRPTMLDRVFGQEATSYRTNLHGHDRAVTAVSVVTDPTGESDVLLVSGDEGGTVRVWDLASRGCVRVLHPWSSQSIHPVTSIRVVSFPNEQATSLFADNNRNDAKRNSLVHMLSPLQKFAVESLTSIQLPKLPRRSGPNLWKGISEFDVNRALAKRQRAMETPVPAAEDIKPIAHTETPPSVETAASDLTGEVERLRTELDEAKSTIQRWETVNNKLLARLQQEGN